MTQVKTAYIDYQHYMVDKEAIKKEMETLEVKLAYQEDTIESLNQTVIEQQSKISQLEKKMALLIEKLKSEPRAGDGISTDVELPPHY